MIILMRSEATTEQTADVMDAIASRGLHSVDLPGGGHTAIGIDSAIPPEIRESLANSLDAMPGVDHVVHVSRPYKLASREFHSVTTTVRVRDVEIGGTEVVVAAGPCAVETRDQIIAAAKAVKASG